MKREAEVREGVGTSPGRPRVASKAAAAGREAWDSFPHSLQTEPALPTPVFWASGPDAARL